MVFASARYSRRAVVFAFERQIGSPSFILRVVTVVLLPHNILHTAGWGSDSFRMGPGKSQRGSSQNFESQDSLLGDYLESMSEKSRSTREYGLQGLTDFLESNVKQHFSQKCLGFLLEALLKSLKRDFREVALAAHALGLLAVTLGEGEMTNKVLENFIPQFSRLVKRELDATTHVTVLQALAIIAFVGGDVEDTKESMDLLWNHVVGASKPEPAVMDAAISGWTFLLTTLTVENFTA